MFIRRMMAEAGRQRSTLLLPAVLALIWLNGCRPAAPLSQATPGVAAPAPSVQFTDVTLQSGLGFRQEDCQCGQRYFVEQIASGATVIDANGDGFPDLYFPQPQPIGVCKHPAPLHQRLYLNDGKGHFTLSPSAFRGVDTDYGIAAAAGDYDNDGHEDLYVSCYGKSRLFHNRGDGTFEDVTDKAGVGVKGFSSGAVWFDADGDGRLDLYVMRYCEWNVQTDVPCHDANGQPDVCHPTTYTPATNVFFHNNGNGTFTQKTLAVGFGSEKRRSLSACAVDFDGDGRLDLFVTNDIGPNYMFHNKGKGVFEDVAMQQGVAFGLSGATQANMGVAVGDYNNTGRMSVLVTTFSNEPRTLYRNDGGYFTDVSAPAGIAQPTMPYLAFGTGFLDTRNSGALDLFIANGHVSPSARLHYDKEQNYKEPNQLLLNDGRGRFTEAKNALPADDVRVHRGAVFADFDNDGRMDILTTATDDRPTLLRNDSQAGNWLLLRLTNKQGCATPVGTRCTATVNGKRLLRVVLGGGSYGGNSDMRVHFGLDTATSIDTLEIAWMSGAKQVFHNVPANQILSLREGQSLSASPSNASLRVGAK